MSLMAGGGGNLWHVLASVPDHRRAEGKRYPLASLLLIAVAAMLSGRRDQLGIVRWGRRLSRDTLASIGIRRARVPAPSVWCEMFKALDIAALERALGHWVRGGQSAGHVALDGKRLRGSATAQAAGVHLLAAFSASLQGVIGQLAVAPEGNEITTALHLLKTLPLRGAVITGDAMFTQTEICRSIIDGGGDYFLTVKDNQPTLKADIALAFGPDSPSAEWTPPPDLRHTETIETGHGRIETRRLEVTATLAEHLAPSWPGLAQVCRLTRARVVRGKTSHETVYAITK